MAFEFKARVLLELGAELISSDAVALFELVKNSLDAKSPEITIDVTVAMQHSVYSQFLELLEDYTNQEGASGASDFDADIFNEAVLDALEESVTDETRRLFKRAYGSPASLADARTRLQEAYVEANQIAVVDRGDGMSTRDLKADYLTVGTPGRLHEKKTQARRITTDKSRLHYTKFDSMPLGEKGIGRFSAMRLGHLVRVQTKRSGERVWNSLEMDWRPAFADPTMDATDPLLDFRPVSAACERKDIDNKGTTIRISDLQADWSLEKIRRVAANDLAKLADPYASIRANRFLKVVFQGKPVRVPSLDREPLESCDAVVDALFRYDEDAEPELSITVNYRRLGREKSEKLRGDHLRSCVREEPSAKKLKKPQLLLDAEVVGRALKHLGPWELRFYWFNRGRLQRDERELWDTSIKGFIEQWGGGFLVYRDGYRVYPYGERSDDWLDLDRKALAGGAFKLNRAQIAGYLRLSSVANPMLLDQTNREGFRDSPDKEALRRLLRYIVIGSTRQFLEEVERKVAPPIEQVVEEVQERITTSKDAAVASLKSMQGRVPTEQRNIATVLHHLEEVSEAWERAKLRIAHLDSEIDRYIHLAGVGLMLEFIAHELSRVTQDTLKAVASGSLPPEVVEAQLKTLEKRVRILDELSIPGRQIRRKESIRDLVEMLVDFHEAKAARHNIKIEIDPPSDRREWEERLEKGQFLQILDNLLSNSFYWLMNRLDTSKKALIRIELDRQRRELRVTDNGPGISPDRRQRVFDQFDTTKPPREGRGLGLFIARKLAEENNATLALGAPARDGMLRTFVLAFGAGEESG